MHHPTDMTAHTMAFVIPWLYLFHYYVAKFWLRNDYKNIPQSKNIEDDKF